MNPEENLDEVEIVKLLGIATRPNVRKLLETEQQRLRKQSEMTAKKTITKTATESSNGASTSISVRPRVKISTYGWDESDKFIKLYLSQLNKVQDLPKERITSEFTFNSFSLLLSDLAGKDYEMSMKDLCGSIVPAECVVKQKTDSLLVMLKKMEPTTWSVLTKTEKREKDKTTSRMDSMATGDPESSMMSMMKDLYDSGDDEMKRSIRKAWHEGQNKRGGMPEI